MGFFPIPRFEQVDRDLDSNLSRSVKQRIGRRREIIDDLNLCVDALNWSSGGAKGPVAVEEGVAEEVHDHLRQRVLQRGSPDFGGSNEEAAK